MHFATPLAFALVTSFLASATPSFPSADKTIIIPDRTRPSILGQLALVKDTPDSANIITLAEDTINLPYNFTLSATAQGRNPDPSLFWSFADREIHQWGMLGDAVEFSLRDGKLIYDNYEVGFGFYTIEPDGSSLERPGKGWDFYATSQGRIKLIRQGIFACDTYSKRRPISYAREYFELYQRKERRRGKRVIIVENRRG